MCFFWSWNFFCFYVVNFYTMGFWNCLEWNCLWILNCPLKVIFWCCSFALIWSLLVWKSILLLLLVHFCHDLLLPVSWLQLYVEMGIFLILLQHWCMFNFCWFSLTVITNLENQSNQSIRSLSCNTGLLYRSCQFQCLCLLVTWTRIGHCQCLCSPTWTSQLLFCL